MYYIVIWLNSGHLHSDFMPREKNSINYKIHAIIGIHARIGAGIHAITLLHDWIWVIYIQISCQTLLSLTKFSSRILTDIKLIHDWIRVYYIQISCERRKIQSFALLYDWIKFIYIKISCQRKKSSVGYVVICLNSGLNVKFKFRAKGETFCQLWNLVPECNQFHCYMIEFGSFTFKFRTKEENFSQIPNLIPEFSQLHCYLTDFWPLYIQISCQRIKL